MNVRQLEAFQEAMQMALDALMKPISDQDRELAIYALNYRLCQIKFELREISK